MKQKKLLTFGLMACMAFLAGCGISKASTNTEDISKPKEEKQDHRVVAASVAVTELLDKLGVEMVGVPTSTYELPEKAKKATPIGNPMKPDMEIIASLNPTIVVGVDTLGDDLKKSLHDLSIETLLLTLNNYDGLKNSIQTLGEKFNATSQTNDLLKQFTKKEEEMKTAIKGKESPDVLIIFGAGANFMVASENSYVGDLVKMAGGNNILKDAPSAFVPVDMEYLADKNPDMILFMCHANPEESLEAFKTEFKTNKAWENFTAVQEDKVIALEPKLFGMSANLATLDAMDEIVDILYGE